MEIRELTSVEEFEACIGLQRECFGRDDLNLQPVRFYVVCRMVGGLVLGAFDGSTLVGFLSTVAGIRDRRPYWHSHMLAVTTSHRNTGIGTHLKLAQKQEALSRGIDLIEWTFDPLVSRNAYLNIEKLGVIIRRYKAHLYSLDEDRLVAEWWLSHPRPVIAEDARRVSIPSDAMKAKVDRNRVREELTAAFQNDFYVAAFERRGDTSDYILIPGASRADQRD
jgi:predicted GNAT superfamily acetyltransferase